MSARQISERIGTLRQMEDSDRAKATRDLALAIRALPDGVEKLGLAASLANLSTEGDFGHENLQEVGTTLALAVQSAPKETDHRMVEEVCTELAQLAKYEGLKIDLKLPAFTQAKADLEATDEARAKVDFTLKDLDGRSWTLSELKGKVVVVNFWATWCPPCRKEMPDLEALYAEFKSEGLVILAVSDEPRATVEKFVAANMYSFPVLLDSDRKVGGAFKVSSIPKSFVYDRQGKLVAQSMDMRTRHQFLTLLAKAGIHEKGGNIQKRP